MCEVEVQGNGDGAYTHTFTGMSAAQMGKMVDLYIKLDLELRVSQHMNRCAGRRKRRRMQRR